MVLPDLYSAESQGQKVNAKRNLRRGKDGWKTTKEVEKMA